MLISPSLHQNGLEMGRQHSRLVRVRHHKKFSTILAAVEGATLAEVLAKTPRKYRGGFGVLALPAMDVFMRSLRVEETEFANFDRAVLTEAQRHLPYSIDFLSMDWVVIRQEGMHRDVQIAAVKKTTADMSADLLLQHHIIPVALESEALAIARAVLSHDEWKTGDFLLCDLREDRLLIVLFGTGGVESTLVYEPLGWKQLLQRVQHVSKTDEEDAKKTVLSKGFHRSSGKRSQQLVRDFEQLVAYVREALEYYHDRYQRMPKVYLTGYLRLVPGISEAFQQALGSPVELRSSAHHFLKGSNDAKKIDREPQWDVALGEALYVVNV